MEWLGLTVDATTVRVSEKRQMKLKTSFRYFMEKYPYYWVL